MANIQSHLDNIKNAERGESVRDAVCAALKAINEDNPVVTKPLSVTQNGTYTGEGGIAYNPVTVNVEGGGQSGIAFDSLNVTENGYYEPNEGHAYIGVNVNVPQQTSELGEKIIQENGIYEASGDGLDGYSKIYVQVGAASGPFTVKFYDSDGVTLLGRVDNVPFGGGAVYPGGTPTKAGAFFIGWSPNPSNVTRNMECVAAFSNVTGGTIEDSWIDIAKNVQNNPQYYPLGSTKYLDLGSYTDPEGKQIKLGSMTMQLVGIEADALEGNNGYAPTTWLSKDNVLSEYYAYTDEDHPSLRWDEGCWLRLYLSTVFAEHFPQDLLRYVKPVVKYTGGYDNGGLVVTDYTSIDRFWIPSVRELSKPMWNNPIPDTMETQGPIYELGSDSDKTVKARKSNGDGTGFSYWLRTSTKPSSPAYYAYTVAVITGNYANPAAEEKKYARGAQGYSGAGKCILLGFCI